MNNDEKLAFKLAQIQALIDLEEERRHAARRRFFILAFIWIGFWVLYGVAILLTRPG